MRILLPFTLAAASLSAQSPCDETAQLTAFGAGWPGATGVPVLSPQGLPVVGGPHVQLELAFAAASSPALVIVGLELLPLSLPGGATVYPGPPWSIATFVTDAAGAALLHAPGTIDPALCGLDAWAQVAIADSGGWALTRALGLRLGGAPEVCAPPARLYPMPAYDLGDGCVSLVVDDLDVDGHVDMLVVESASRVLVARGLGAGSYALPLRTSLGPGRAGPAAVGDLDGDGLPDVVVADDTFPVGGLSVLLGAGGGALGTASNVEHGATTTSLALDDLDGDGALDVVTTDPLHGHWSIWWGTGDGTLEAPVDLPSAFASPRRVLLEDFDASGSLDVVLLFDDESATSFALHRGLGGGSFGPAELFESGWEQPLELATADMDGNGRLDLAFAGHFLSVVLADLAGGFAEPVLYDASGGNPHLLALANLGGTPQPDVVTAGPNLAHNVQVRMNKGDGELHASTHWPTYWTGLRALVCADADEDGRTDLCMATVDGVLVLPNLPSAKFAVVEAFDLKDSYWDMGAADLDGDGALDVIATSPDIVVAYGAGDGSLLPPVVVHPGEAGHPWYQLAVGEVDGDGIADAVIARAFERAVLHGGSVLVLAAPFYVPDEMLLADLDGDGLDDLVEAYSSAKVELGRSNGDGTFTPWPSLATHEEVRAVASADLDLDGAPDLLLVRDSQVQVWAGDGHGGFTKADEREVGGWALDVCAGDWNGDLLPDVAVTREGLATLVVFTGTGQIELGSSAVLGERLTSSEMLSVEIDGDGLDDLVIATLDGIALLRGPALDAPQHFGLSANDLAVGDVDGDGHLDLFGVAYTGGGRLYRNRCP